MAPGRHRRRYRAGAVGRCATVAVGAAAIAAGFSSVAAAPAPPDDPTLIARSARAAFAVPAEDHAVDDAGDDAGVDASALAERRASRDLIRPPVTPPLLPAAPPTDTLPPPTAPGAAPQTDPTPRFTTSTARTGAAVEGGLTANAMKVLNAVRAAYPQLTSFGGARSQRGSDHSTGQAIDIMIPSQALGDAMRGVCTRPRRRAGRRLRHLAPADLEPGAGRLAGHVRPRRRDGEPLRSRARFGTLNPAISSSRVLLRAAARRATLRL